MDYMLAIKQYIDTFNEGPPVIGMEENEAISRIKQALETGEKIKEGAEVNRPKDVLL